MEQTNQKNTRIEVKESKKEIVATYASLIICLLPGFWISVIWYELYAYFSKEYNWILTAAVVLVIAYLTFITTQAILKQIILFIIK